jgi:hypothetical protein
MRKTDHLKDIASQTQRRKLGHRWWIGSEMSSKQQICPKGTENQGDL